MLSVILVLLLAGHLVYGVTEESIVLSGRAVYLRTEVEKAQRCVLETNQGDVLKYKPERGNIRDDIRCIDYSWDKTCSVIIDEVNRTHAGVWKLTAYSGPKKNETSDLRDEKMDNFTFVLYVQEKASIPVDHIEVYDGHYVNVKHSENYNDLKACNLTGPTKKSIDLVTETRDDLELFGRCGVRMKVDGNSSGTWTLSATNGSNDYVRHVASFRVEVHHLKRENEDPSEMLVLQWIRGRAGVINLPIRPKICQIVDPDGVIVTVSRGECYHKVKIATVRHEGVWLARYNMLGMLKPIEQRFRVETVDRMIFNASVNYTENDGVTLLCQMELRSADSLESCSFVQPNGTVLYMTPVVGNERYTAYIEPQYGYSSKVLKCGLTISKLERVDYGAWRCNLRISYVSGQYGSILHVDHPDSSKHRSINATRITDSAIEVRADNVHVKRGDPFTIKCVVDHALKYCWLRSPNGTAYSVTLDKEVESPFVLHYEGTGLSFGECGTKISAAVDSDNGQWSCFMGVIGSGEETAIVPVIVAETYIVAEQTEIAVNPSNDPVLSCHILPHMLDITVHYCRWIRPDGYGIYNDISHRYTTNSSYSQCRLVILNYRPEVDNGRWTCVAGLSGEAALLEEAWDHISVLSYNGTSINETFVGLIAGSVLLLIVILGTVGYITACNRRRTPPTDPPVYCPQENYYPPKALQPQYDTKNEYQY